METIDRWLKSLRLHKYTHLFKTMTYEEMLNIEEKLLVDLDITKGARNKILVSIRKLNLRQDRLINMIDDIIQDNISMKEALTVLKEMLITPIPRPLEALSCTITTPTSESGALSPISPSISPAASSGIASLGDTSKSGSNSDNESSTGGSGPSSLRLTSPPNSTISTAASLCSSMSLSSKTSTSASALMNYHSDPYELTHLFVETFEKVAYRLIESGGFEDNACHGIMAAIVDECLKHNSFTDEQKARVARIRQHRQTGANMNRAHEQNSKPMGRVVGASYKHQPYQYQQQQPPFYKQHYSHQTQQPQQQQPYRIQQHKVVNIYNHLRRQQQQQQQQQQQRQNCTHNYYPGQFQYQPHNHHQYQNQSAPRNIHYYHQQHQPSYYQRDHKQQSLQAHYHHNYPRQQQQQQQQQSHADHWNGTLQRQKQVSPSSLSMSTIGSLSNNETTSDEEEQQQQKRSQPSTGVATAIPLASSKAANVEVSYREYTLLGPGLTFELPCLRARAEADKNNRDQLSFF